MFKQRLLQQHELRLEPTTLKRREASNTGSSTCANEMFLPAAGRKIGSHPGRRIAPSSSSTRVAAGTQPLSDVQFRPRACSRGGKNARKF